MGKKCSDCDPEFMSSNPCLSGNKHILSLYLVNVERQNVIQYCDRNVLPFLCRFLFS